MGGFSVVVLMSILSFIYLFFIAIFVAVVLYIIMSYTFQGISIMCMCKNIGINNPNDKTLNTVNISPYLFRDSFLYQ